MKKIFLSLYVLVSFTCHPGTVWKLYDDFTTPPLNLAIWEVIKSPSGKDPIIESGRLIFDNERNVADDDSDSTGIRVLNDAKGISAELVVDGESMIGNTVFSKGGIEIGAANSVVAFYFSLEYDVDDGYPSIGFRWEVSDERPGDPDTSILWEGFDLADFQIGQLYDLAAEVDENNQLKLFVNNTLVQTSPNIAILGSIGDFYVASWTNNGRIRGFADNVEVLIDDNVAPVITVNPETVTLVVGSAAPNLLDGVTATDDVDGDISTQVTTNSSVDVTTIGSYNIEYNVSDQAGNAAQQKTRTYVVVAAVTSATLNFTGTLGFISLDNGSSIYSGVNVGDTFSGSFTYGTSSSDASSIETDFPIGVDFQFTGMPYGGFITDGSLTTTGVDTLVLTGDNDSMGDDTFFINNLYGTSVPRATESDTWGVSSSNGTQAFGLDLYSLDTNLFSGLDFQILPLTLDNSDFALFYLEETDASSENIIYQAVGKLTSIGPGDADNDGLPDSWENQYGDLEPEEDNDGDDIPNIVEFQEDLNPLVADNDANLLILTTGWNLVSTPGGGVENQKISEFFDGKTKGLVWTWNSNSQRFESVLNENLSSKKAYWVFSSNITGINLQ